MSNQVKETNESMCRNQLGSILGHFSMLDALEKVEESKKENLLKIIEDNKVIALSALKLLTNKIKKNKKVNNNSEDEEEILTNYKTEDLYNADPNCNHKVIALWSGVKCKLCGGWFCY